MPPLRHQLLRDYVDVAILRDVVERHRVTNVAGLRWLVRHLLGNAAGLFSVEKFHAALKSQGLAIGRDTVHQLLGHLEALFPRPPGLYGVEVGTSAHGEPTQGLSRRPWPDPCV